MRYFFDTNWILTSKNIKMHVMKLGQTCQKASYRRLSGSPTRAMRGKEREEGGNLEGKQCFEQHFCEY